MPSYSFHFLVNCIIFKLTFVLSFKYVFPLIINPVPLGEVQQLSSTSFFPCFMEPWNWLGSRSIGATFKFNSLLAPSAAYMNKTPHKNCVIQKLVLENYIYMSICPEKKLYLKYVSKPNLQLPMKHSLA